MVWHRKGAAGFGGKGMGSRDGGDGNHTLCTEYLVLSSCWKSRGIVVGRDAVSSALFRGRGSLQRKAENNSADQ